MAIIERGDANDEVNGTYNPQTDYAITDVILESIQVCLDDEEKMRNLNFLDSIDLDSVDKVFNSNKNQDIELYFQIDGLNVKVWNTPNANTVEVLVCPCQSQAIA